MYGARFSGGHSREAALLALTEGKLSTARQGTEDWTNHRFNEFSTRYGGNKAREAGTTEWHVYATGRPCTHR